MKLGLVYNPKDRKLQHDVYSQVYRSQFLALLKQWDGNTVHIYNSCSAKDIEADVIIFYDVHSCHHIKIEGIKNHPAVKYEYFNDPHQITVKGHYAEGTRVHKLNAEDRCKRALDRGVDYIICPFTEPYYEHLAPYLEGRAEKMRVWFPPAPNLDYFTDRYIRLKDRIPEVLANGATIEAKFTHGYEFRKWAYKQPYVKYLTHIEVGHDGSAKVPSGKEYPNFLATFAASLALTDDHIVPKYLEIPLAGCVCFAREHQDYRNMGFKDGENCIFVNRENFESKVRDFLAHIGEYQSVADSGRELIENNWTSKHFAEFVFNHAREAINARQGDAVCV